MYNPSLIITEVAVRMNPHFKNSVPERSSMAVLDTGSKKERLFLDWLKNLKGAGLAQAV
jgi:DNA primase